jgi:amino acid adenylation domain-containing protein
VGQLLAQLKETVLAGHAHQDVPFEQVVEAVNPVRSLSHNPVFQAMLAFNPVTGMEQLNLTKLVAAPLAQSSALVHFDLSLNLSETDECLVGALEYASDLFDRATVKRFAGYLHELLSSMVASPDLPVLALPMLSEAENQLLLQGFNATTAAYPHESTAHQLFEKQVACRPDAKALLFGEESLSYAQLNRRANQLAHYLRAQGIGPDDRVALCVDRGMDMVVGLLGIWKAGGAYVPLDPHYPAERLAYMLDDSAPVLAITHAGFLRESAPEGLPVLDLSCAKQQALLSAQADGNPEVRGLQSSHLAYVIYTSGSTGKAKGVMVEHRSLVNFWQVLSDTIYAGIEAGATVALNASFSFDMSLKGLLQLLSGHALLIVPHEARVDATRFLDLLREHDVAAFDCTPSQLEVLERQGLLGMADYHPQRILIGGEAIPERLWRALASAPHTISYNMYGPTEATIDATLGRVEAGAKVNIGRPLGNARIYILDRSGAPVALGVAGEIHIAGVGLSRAYLQRAELTAERFLIDPFSTEAGARMYKTGDLGRWLPDGTIEYLGRNDFQVKLRGFRIELGEIEAQLGQCEGVRDATVVVWDDGMTEGKRLVAYVVVQPGTQLSPAALRATLAQKLPDYMVPVAYVELSVLPLNANGKLDRAALPAPGHAAMAMRDYAPPEGAVEESLAQIWQTVLGVERVGRHDHFFELGGNSLNVIQFAHALQEHGLHCTPRTLFEAPTLSALAIRILVDDRNVAYAESELEKVEI